MTDAAPVPAVPKLLLGVPLDMALFTLTYLVGRIRKGRASLVDVSTIEAHPNATDWVTKTVCITYVEAKTKVHRDACDEQNADENISKVLPGL